MLYSPQWGAQHPGSGGMLGAIPQNRPPAGAPLGPNMQGPEQIMKSPYSPIASAGRGGMGMRLPQGPEQFTQISQQTQPTQSQSWISQAQALPGMNPQIMAWLQQMMGGQQGRGGNAPLRF